MIVYGIIIFLKEKKMETLKQLELNSILLVINEINNVVSAMRLNTRWASRNRSSVNQVENPLLKGFKNLKKQLDTISDISEIDTLVYLKPFLSVIRSEETSGPITGVALTSVNKFLSYLIVENSMNADKALENIAETVTHCRFEATDPDSDEVVLMKILQVLLSCINSPLGWLLPNDLVIEMVQTCFRMSNQARLSELLRKNAENTLIEMIKSIFYTFSRNNSGKSNQTNENSYPSENVKQSKEEFVKEEFVNPQGVLFKREMTTKLQRSFGIECITDLFKFICSIITTPSAELEQDICLLGLSLVNSILETNIKSIPNYPPLLKLIQNDLCCKSLLKCLETENLAILSLSLRIYFNLFLYMREYLKLQLEFFFTVIMKLVENKISYGRQEVILELFNDFSKQAYFMSDVFVNYDCDKSCPNLFESFCKFLSKNSFPVNGIIYTTHMLCLDSLLNLAKTIEDRTQMPNKEETGLSLENLKLMKQKKNLYFAGVEIFNKDQEAGIKFLQENGLLPDPITPKSVAFFLRNIYGINKTVIGEYLGKKKDFNMLVLEEYLKTFQMETEESFLDTVRIFLESFRIPGEAQIISRVLEALAQYYFSVVGEPFKSADAAYVLAYSIVMLNVDQHNPEVKKRMTENDFIKNNRGINEKEDLPKEMLQAIYHNIKNREIKIPEEQLMHENFLDDGWPYVLNRRKCVNFYLPAVQEYDREIFYVIWGPLMTAISFSKKLKS